MHKRRGLFVSDGNWCLHIAHTKGHRLKVGKLVGPSCPKRVACDMACAHVSLRVAFIAHHYYREYTLSSSLATQSSSLATPSSSSSQLLGMTHKLILHRAFSTIFYINNFMYIYTLISINLYHASIPKINEPVPICHMHNTPFTP